MNSKSTFGIHFVLKNSKVIDETAPIYARITVDTNRVEISVKKRIPVSNWHKGKGLAKGKTTDISRLNSYLEQFRSQLTECYQELVVNKQTVTPEAIKNKFLGVEDSGETLKGLVEYHNTGMDSNLRWGTLKNYKTTEKYIEKFLKQKFKRNDIYLVELNYKFITDFEHFLRKYQPEDHHLPMGNNTVMKHIERLRKMTNLAVRLGWLDKDPFVAYRLSFKRVEREFLTQLELDTIKKKQFKIERLQYVKDLFVFSCYTGLSYIDVMNLQPNNIRIGINGMNWIITQREKTTTPVRIPILSQAQVLIDKYKDHPRSANKGTIFPNISNQKLNSYLKEIADVCEIDKNLTFHVARHTFATTVTLTNGVPIESVSKMLGHTDLKTTQIYAKVVEKKISDDMANLEAYLSGERSKKKNAK
ncbi:Site-specific recombinase XerD [Draconibacterium orientale]|uniref:Integrase n=1 Tax=Draconibacterium orientale TaxID=1168034 RepID=X5DHT2_9BACT|nr:site-specific integrase [Draconibacterium orientale]AHW60649.1 integrase [Draconibacterium orientale]SET79184.1 Site-specific recombinase XerD [Draconibacterium orientale]